MQKSAAVLLSLFFLFLWHCAVMAQPTSQPSTSRPAGFTMPRPVPPPRVQTTIEGTVLSHLGKPMKVAHVQLHRSMFPEERIVVRVQPDGRFRLQTNRYGVYWLLLSGVNHRTKRVMLLLEKPRKIWVQTRLQRMDLRKKLAKLTVLGSFNNFSIGKAKAMKRRKNGSFVVDLPLSDKPLKYQIFGATRSGRRIHGTRSDDYEYDMYGDYRSIIRAVRSKQAKTIQVVFSPQKLRGPQGNPSFRILPKEAGELDEARRYFQDSKKQYDLALKKFKRTGKAFQHFTYNWEPVESYLKRRRAQTKSPIMREVWALYQISVPKFYHDYKQMDAMIQARKVRLTAILQRTPPNSPLWEVSRALTYDNIRGNLALDAEKPIQLLLQHHPNPGLQLSIREQILFSKGMDLRHLRSTRVLFLEKAERSTTQKKSLLQRARQMEVRIKKLEKEVTSHFNRLQLLTSKYKSRRLQQILSRIRWTIMERFPNGSRVPPFRVQLTDHPEKEFTPKHLRQRYTLVMFWATWCAPCVAKFPQIQTLATQYKQKLQILAVSHDRDVQVWREFRSKKWKMPWYNTVLGDAPYSPLGRLFRIRLLPTMFLLDPTGKVLANGTTLRSNEWQSILTRILDKARLPTPSK